MKKISQATQVSASSMAPVTVAPARGLRQDTRRRQCGHAIGEGAEEDAERPLGHPVLDEAHQDAGRELHRGERQRHQQDGEDDRHHRHDRAGDRAEDDLGDLGIGTGRKQEGGNPGAQLRDALLQRRQHGAEQAERDRDQQRPHQNPPRSAYMALRRRGSNRLITTRSLRPCGLLPSCPRALMPRL